MGSRSCGSLTQWLGATEVLASLRLQNARGIYMKEKIIVAVTSALITTAVIAAVSAFQPAWIISALGGATQDDVDHVQSEVSRLDDNLGLLVIEKGGRITIDGHCFMPHQLVRCALDGDHMTWVDNYRECADVRGTNEGQVTFLAGCS